MDEDFFLGWLASAAGDDWHPAITLSVGGLVVSGELISEDEYFEGISTHYESETPDEALEAWREFVRGLPSKFDEVVMEDLDEGADPEDVREKRESMKESFVFMRDTRIWTATERFFGFSGAFWRGKLSSVDGFWFSRAVGQDAQAGENSVVTLQDDPDRQVEVLEHLRSKGFDACPICGQVLIEESGAIGFGVGREFALTFVEDTNQYISMVPLLCATCGHAPWFNAAKLPGGGE